MKRHAWWSAVAVLACSASAWGQAPPQPGGLAPGVWAPPPPQLMAPAPVGPLYTGDTTLNSPALLGVGIGMTVVGTVGTVVGVGVAANSERVDPCYSGVCPDMDLGMRAAGLVTTFVSLALIGVGLPLILVGARQVPEARGSVSAYVGADGIGFTW